MLTLSKFYKCILFSSVAVLSGTTTGNKHTVAYIDNNAKNNIVLNGHVRQFVSNYIKNNQETLVAVRERSASPFKLIDSVFTRYGLPKEMKYLAVIESELNPRALSKVGARGTWQLMPTTAQLLGLKVDSTHDERTQLGKSTVAAAKYLRDLYGEFGDWLLVLAAYNGGPAPVYRAIHKAGSRNFWALERFLPAESRGHVKRFIASHYYFEGNGSVTTSTKAEWATYVQRTAPTGTAAFATL
jgi:membrane-bound lytic murein transglycosylase D